MADDNEEQETDEDRFNRMYEARRKSEREAEQRAKKLKDMGITDDVLDTIGEAVFRVFQRNAEQRQAEKDAADQEPSRTSGQEKPLERFLFGGGKREAS